ncbi:MAG: hypothetical protein H0T62_06495 [Parachlamydiaceae bacterium]|nr:hypothetical protein [Parachlamydiaceae bacterium]
MNYNIYEELKKQAACFKPLQLVEISGFNKSLETALSMLNNEEWEESLQEYATYLLEAMRRKYPEKWNSSWRYDALLGYAYHITLKYEERYLAYKRSLDKVSPAPPELLVALARCCIAPGKPPLSEAEAILLVKEAIKTTPYVEGIELLKGLYKSIGNKKEQEYWEDVLSKISKNGPHLPPLEDFSNEI